MKDMVFSQKCYAPKVSMQSDNEVLSLSQSFEDTMQLGHLELLVWGETLPILSYISQVAKEQL